MVENCTIGNDDSERWIHRGIHIEVNKTTDSKPVTYTIRDSVFEKQIFRDPVVSAVNIHYAVLSLRVFYQSGISFNITGEFYNFEIIII